VLSTGVSLPPSGTASPRPGGPGCRARVAGQQGLGWVARTREHRDGQADWYTRVQLLTFCTIIALMYNFMPQVGP
jgi:hypothetical protein